MSSKKEEMRKPKRFDSFSKEGNEENTSQNNVNVCNTSTNKY